MHRFKYGNLRSNGKKVTSRKQAIAMSLSESGQSRKPRSKRSKRKAVKR